MGWVERIAKKLCVAWVPERDAIDASIRTVGCRKCGWLERDQVRRGTQLLSSFRALERDHGSPEGKGAKPKAAVHLFGVLWGVRQIIRAPRSSEKKKTKKKDNRKSARLG